jgi:hypothetical protein
MRAANSLDDLKVEMKCSGIMVVVFWDIRGLSRTIETASNINFQWHLHEPVKKAFTPSTSETNVSILIIFSFCKVHTVAKSSSRIRFSLMRFVVLR